MQITKLILAGVLAFFALLAKPEVSRADVCISDFRPVQSFAHHTAGYGGKDEGFRLYYAAMTCRELDAWKMGLKAATFAYEITTMGLACTQVGIPVAIGMLGVGSTLYAADLFLTGLPCESDSKAEIERLVRQEVCQALTQQGIACDPQSLKRK